MDISFNTLRAKITSLQMLSDRGVHLSQEEKFFASEEFTLKNEENLSTVLEFYINAKNVDSVNDFRVSFTSKKGKTKVEEGYTLLHPGEESPSDKNIMPFSRFLNVLADNTKNNERLLSGVYYSPSQGGSELLMVYFSGSESYNTNEHERITQMCERFKIYKIIVITKIKPTSGIQKIFQKDVPRYIPANESNFGLFTWQNFLEKELQINTSRHFFQPKMCRVLNEDERLLLRSYEIPINSLPAWYITNALVRYYGFGVDDVIFFERYNDMENILTPCEYAYVRIIDENAVKRKSSKQKSNFF